MNDYRYALNGMEYDDEVQGGGNSINYKYRMYNPRLGRFFAVDPLTTYYPQLTPYQFCSNSPIAMKEIEGMEGVQIVDHQSRTTTITVDFFFVPLENGNFKENGPKKTRLTSQDAQKVKESIYLEFDKMKFYDFNHKNEFGNPYRVQLNINLIPFKSRVEKLQALAKATEDPLDPFELNKYNQAISLYKMDRVTRYDNEGNVIGFVNGTSRKGELTVSDVNNSHTNTHELFHDLIHNHSNASDKFKNMISSDGDQEPGHLTAGGIFIYKNENTGQDLQDLNQGNINDALEVLPTIESGDKEEFTPDGFYSENEDNQNLD